MYDDFQALDVQIVGVSFDAVAQLQSWAEQESFQFELWSDTNKSLALHYGAASSPNAWVADRISVLLDRNGEVLLTYMDNVSVGAHPKEVLDDCRILFGE